MGLRASQKAIWRPLHLLCSYGDSAYPEASCGLSKVPQLLPQLLVESHGGSWGLGAMKTQVLGSGEEWWRMASCLSAHYECAALPTELPRQRFGQVSIDPPPEGSLPGEAGSS